MRGFDLKYPELSDSTAAAFVLTDLRDVGICHQIIDTRFDEVYQLAANMGGAGYISTVENEADVMHSSATIILKILNDCHRHRVRRVFYSSSTYMYPEHNQRDPKVPVGCEDRAKSRPALIL